MTIEKSAGAVVFHMENGKIHYLLLRYPTSMRNTKKEYWGFPKGHIEKGEKLEETIEREIKEETGLKDIKFIDGFKDQEKYFFTKNKQKISKTVAFLLAETGIKNIRISQEHLGFKWLPYKEAFKKLTFKNAKRILQEANNFLPGKSI